MAANIGSNISPKIALNFDKFHSNPNEIAIHRRLEKLNPAKKIVYFRENRHFETESRNQYSLELLAQDEPISTATPCLLLSACMLTRDELSFFKQVLYPLYTDPYLKKLFLEGDYLKFDPYQHGLDKSIQWAKLDKKTMTNAQKNTIENVEKLFHHLDCTLSQKAVELREWYLDQWMFNAAKETTDKNNNSFDYTVILKIAEAIAFMKIKQVLAKLNPDSDKSKELSLDMINRLFQGQDRAWELWTELNIKIRTQFQAKKLIKATERILNAKDADPNTIFLVRVGSGHSELLISHLTQHFKKGEVKEIVLNQDDLPEVEQKIREKFSAAPNLLPQPSNVVVGTRSGTCEMNDPLLQGLPVFQFSE